jgi:membrane associated rhomboid family serine protease
VFPISDHNPTRITPYVTYVLIGANIFIFLYQLRLTAPQLEQFFQLYAVVPKQLTASFGGIPVNQAVPEPLTLVTSQFLHGGFLHILGNMLFLWIFGNNIEDKLGHIKYVIFILLVVF